MKIKVFLDGADKNQILEFNQNSNVKGFTTNPSLMKKAGVKEYKPYCVEILKHIGNKPISFEVFADDFPTMKDQALKIASWEKEIPNSNIYVKIPVMNTQKEPTTKLIHELSHKGVKLNVTAIFTVEQTQSVCEALKGGAPSIVSVFAGRVADVGIDPLPLMEESATLCEKAGDQVELLWASTREVYNIVQADLLGCKIITAPGDLIKKLSGFGKKPIDLSLETVKTFKSDSDAAGFSL